MHLYELTKRLIDIPSVSGEEAAIGEFLERYLINKGYRVERQTVEANRFNLIATTAAKPLVVMSTHLDTVPPFIRSREDDEHIYGRGACDVKGIIAAMLAAGEQLNGREEKRYGFLFVVGEETTSIGAQTANRHPMASDCQFLINGEPTQNKLASGSKGSLRVRLKTTGKAAHSAYPEQGESAIERLLDVLHDVRKIHWTNDDFFGATTCNIGTLQGGVRPNVIPFAASAELQIRLVCESAVTLQQLKDAVGQQAEIELQGITERVKLHTVDGFESEVVRFTTDVPHLSNWGQPLLLGAGSILDAHTADEKINKQQLSESVDLYAGLVARLLAEV